MGFCSLVHPGADLVGEGDEAGDEVWLFRMAGILSVFVIVLVLEEKVKCTRVRKRGIKNKRKRVVEIDMVRRRARGLRA
jgi:hypothetical protein